MSLGPIDRDGDPVQSLPPGAFDPDWLVPSVLVGAPGHSPEEARDALLAGWSAIRAGGMPPGGTMLADAAAEVLGEAATAFGAGPPLAPPA
ncbi:hypothetical protein OEB99_18625 [Actinotalea sp. M2MS4P-6]|uniref:hypothetical protein n=1 Tax=Actinotalea sp. M2MS4P-6 TaxID=2983762 RepID=UPI0021E4FE3D|nr:hypothetical protein [Actinotalea sp. M2MS4P-6]MCV2396330.1 hypothetical protein [Actinotalea sp. M2MS4P-6]